MCPSAPRVCSEPGGQKPVLSMSLDRIINVCANFHVIWNRKLITAQWATEKNSCFIFSFHFKVHGDNMGSIWGWQDPGGPHVGLINFAICTYKNLSVPYSLVNLPFAYRSSKLKEIVKMTTSSDENFVKWRHLFI